MILDENFDVEPLTDMAKDTSTNLSSLVPLDPERYAGIDHDRLLAYVVTRMNQINLSTTFENVTAAAYALFPSVFCLSGYPQYPDAARVNRTLLHGGPKYKNYLVGRATTGYELSERGKAAADQAQEMMASSSHGKSRRSRAPRVTAPRNVIERTEREVRESDAFRLWKAQEPIPTAEFYLFLHLFPGSEPAAVRENLKAMRNLLEGSADRDIADFIKSLATTFRKEID